MSTFPTMKPTDKRQSKVVPNLTLCVPSNQNECLLPHSILSKKILVLNSDVRMVKPKCNKMDVVFQRQFGLITAHLPRSKLEHNDWIVETEIKLFNFHNSSSRKCAGCNYSAKNRNDFVQHIAICEISVYCNCDSKLLFL